ncbi:MAG: tetratricopeptide repeat protein [Treponema sp.]|jgi:hypothetical protein|nr:tetratricopeptide repeat protein [Treponema sp.]
MPSLSELREFKASFNDIGGQKADLESRKIPFDDLELPNSEPEPLPNPVEANVTGESSAPADSAAADFDETEPLINPADGIDFSAFLGSQPDDLPEPPAAIMAEDEMAQSPDDLYAPEGLLSNLSEELDAIPPDFPADFSDESFSADSGFAGDPVGDPVGGTNLDLDSLDNFDLPEEPPPAAGGPAGGLADSENFDFGIFDDLNLPDEAAPADESGNLDLDNLGGLDLSDEGGDLDLGSLGDLSDMGLSDEAAPADETENLDLDSLGGLGDMGLADEATPADEGGNLDLGSLGDLSDMGLADEAAPADEGGNLDLDSLGDLSDMGLSDEAAPADETENLDLDSLGGLGDMGLSDEAAPADEGGNLDLDNLGDLSDMGLSDEATPADETENLDLGSLGDLSDMGISDEAAPADEGGNFDLDNLGDLGDMGISDEVAPADEGGNFDLDNLGDLGDMGISDEAAPADEDGNFDLDNLGGLGDMGLSDEAAPADEGGNLDLDNLGDLSDMGLSDEAAPADEDGNFDLDNLGGLGISDEAVPADEGGNFDLDNLSGLGDMGLSDEAAPADEGGNFDLDNLSGLGDMGLADEAAPADESENLDLDNADDLGLSDEAAPADETENLDAGIDDFSFPELDNVLKRSQQKTTDTDQKAAKKGKRRGKAPKARTESLPDDVEEIQLSDDEFEGLQETLARYPLNLRIACEEIIAEQAVNPKQMSELIEHLVWGATAKETAILAGRILGRTITVPKGFEKNTGAALEAEQASFAYIFVHNFLPVLRLFMFIAIVAASLFYLVYNYIYTPLKAEKIYKTGYERIFAGEYQRANQRFNEAFVIHRKKDWFYKYAEAFRDERQYIYAEQKYDELLGYYLRDKKGVLDYANLETYYLRNYAKADSLLRTQLLDYDPNDPDGLLAAGDNCLMWGEIEPSKYEDARYYYARLLEKYGWKAPVVERMMKYFIRTDNLKEVLILKKWFDDNPRWELSAESLGELGGYLLDKQLEEVRGVPNEYVEYIDDVRELLLKAALTDPSLPEPHYHLARYYHNLGNTHEERVTLRIAVRTFDEAHEISIRRLNYHIDAIQRYADVLINDREFIPAEEQLIKGINLYEDAVARRLISRSAQYGKLYAGMGDLEYFTKIGDMEAALRYYHRSEQNGWAPPEMQYRMGSAYYQLEDWKNALEYLFAASSSLPLNRRILFALGNTALKRGNYFAAQGYYNRLLDILENQRSRLPVLLPNDRPEYLELAERLMMARNNAGVACEMLADQTGNRSYRTRAISFYAEASRAWDSLTRDPRTMVRSGSTPLPYLNTRNTLYPQPDYEPQIFIRIDREALETSPWENLAPLLRLEHGKNN